MELAYIGYLLFVFPGFCFLWTYRHFTRAPKMGEFEWAGWSFVFGVLLFFLTMYLVGITGTELPAISLTDPAAALGGFLGTGLGITTAASFPLGFACAVVSKKGLFSKVDRALFHLLEWLSKRG
jgi:hypothetical protein